MCGVVGICGVVKNNHLDWIIHSNKLLKHRGPNSSGIWKDKDNKIIFGHRRLSIIDTSDNSNQPFVSNDQRLAIVYNGEIYNYLEVKKKLEKLGAVFRTRGDTEVLLLSYQYWGFDCVNHLNGMWSFAIFDQRKGSGKEILFVSRDRAGEKPFYYKCQNGLFEFASELKAIRSDKQIDLNGLNHYLALGYIPGELSIYKDIKKLKPGHSGIFDYETKTFKTWRYWQLPSQKIIPNQNDKIELDELSQQTWELIKDSVKIRLRSDVSAGVFLSGGLDSSLITAAAASVSEKKIKTFTIGVKNSKLDETKYAKLISEHFDTDHNTLTIENSSMETLEEITKYIDEPIADSSVIPTYLVSKLTQKHVSVALGGDGGDEIFGGYTGYQNILRNSAKFGFIPVSILKIFSKLSSSLSPGLPGRNFISSLKKGFSQSSIWGTPFFDVNLRKKLYSKEILNELGNEIYAPELGCVSIFDEGIDTLDKLMRLDFNHLLPDDHLVKVDRMSMANSLEVRAPFLDHRLIEFSFSKIPSYLKTNIYKRRIIQNFLSKKILPLDFDSDRKQGFSIPINEWMENVPFESITPLGYEGYFNNSFITDLFAKQSKIYSNGPRIFSLLMLNHKK